MIEVYDKNGTKLNLLQDSDIESEKDSFIKFPDGTLICYGYLEREDVSFSMQTGSMYRAIIDSNITFPIPYVTYPRVVVTSGSDADYQYCDVYGVIRNKEGISRIDLLKPVNETGNVLLQYIAIGRWK